MVGFRFLQQLLLLVGLLLSSAYSSPLLSASTALAKRDSELYTLWKSIPNTQKAAGDSATRFIVDRTKNDAWGITYLYGCTAIMIHDGKNVLVGHFQQDGATCVNLDDANAVKSYITSKLQPELDLFDPIEDETLVELLYDGCKSTSVGINAIKNYLKNDWGLQKTGSIRDRRYNPSSGTGEPDPNSPRGLAVVQWTANTAPNSGLINVFFGNSGGEQPIDSYVAVLAAAS